MNGLNHVQISGTVSRRPLIHASVSTPDQCRTHFYLDVPRIVGDCAGRPVVTTDCFPCTAGNALAVAAYRDLTPGLPISLTAVLTNDAWVDDDGRTHDRILLQVTAFAVRTPAAGTSP